MQILNCSEVILIPPESSLPFPSFLPPWIRVELTLLEATWFVVLVGVCRPRALRQDSLLPPDQ